MMGNAEEGGVSYAADSTLWRGVDLSGITLVLGVGTGRLVNLLCEQTRAVGGTVIVTNNGAREMKALRPLMRASDGRPGEAPCAGTLALVQSRPRQIPVLGETVDQLVVNGVLREVPEGRLGRIFGEFWRVLVPGGHLRLSDVIEPSEADYDQAWAERNRVVRKLGRALHRPTALAVDLRLAAQAGRATGFEDLSLSLLPGLALTDAWLEETVNAVRSMAGRIVDRELRNEVLTQDSNRLIAAYARGGQRAATRFVLMGRKPGDQALAMEASFTEDDLRGDM